MKQRFIKDGKVAVVIAPSFGAGWSSWNYNEIIAHIQSMIHINGFNKEYLEE